MDEKYTTIKNIISILIILFLLFIISFQEKFNQFIGKKNMKFLLLLIFIYFIYMKFDLIYLIILLCIYIVSTTDFSKIKKNTYIRPIQEKIEELFSDNGKIKKKETFENKEKISNDSPEKTKEDLNQLKQKIDELKKMNEYFDVKPYDVSNNQTSSESVNKNNSLEENNSSLENHTSIEKNNASSNSNINNQENYSSQEQNNNQNNQEQKELLEKLDQFQFENSSDTHTSQSSPIEPFKDQVSDLNNLFQEIETNFKNKI
jgi:hypothetical protein